jgi:hypothetical protein
LKASSAHDAADEHPGAEMGAKDRPELRAERRADAEESGAVGDQLLGVDGAWACCTIHSVALIQRIQAGGPRGGRSTPGDGRSPLEH